MTSVPFEVVARSVEETREVGRELSLHLVPGALVRLSGPLGAGKTELVRGLAEGLGVPPDEVASPTFALVHEYGPEGRPPLLVHVDLYRLPGDERLGAGCGRGGGGRPVRLHSLRRDDEQPAALRLPCHA